MRPLLAALSLTALTLTGALPASPQALPSVDPAPTQFPAAPIRVLSAEEALADIHLMRRALETIHPGLYRRTPKHVLDPAFDALAAGITGPLTDAALYERISRVLAMIRCTHTKADQTEAMETWRRDNPSHLPFRFRIIEGKMLVVSSDPSQTPLPRGAEIVSINGEPVSALISRLGRYVPIDGFTEPSRAYYLANDSDLMGADFDHFYPYAFGWPQAFTLELRESDAAPVRAAHLAPIPFPTWTVLPNDSGPHRRNFSESTTWKMIGKDVGYLRIDTFVNYRKPADPAALYARALSELRGAGAAKLVVDLRHNAGGSNDAALALIDVLAAAPYTFQRAMRYRAIRYGDLPDYISTWGDRGALFQPDIDRFTETKDGWFDLRPEFAPEELQIRTPARDAFKGPVIVLTGPANASGATMVAAKLRDLGRVTLVGERSGGSADGPTAGTLFNVKLPNSGISVRVPLVFNQMDTAHFDPHGGLAPDILVPATVADFRSKRDRPLERALAEFAKSK
jgi:Peptidase family S41